jgi:uncharacterized tellurite resistance protein B-like protein
MEKEQKHPLLKATDNEKVAYLSIVATIAAADGNISSDEIDNLIKLGEQVKISSDGLGKIISAAKEPNSAPIKKYIEELKSSELRFTLIADMYFLGYADDELTKDEIDEIKKISEQLNVKNEQVEAIAKYVKAMIDQAKGKIKGKETLKNVGSEVAGSLAAAGVPLGAVAVSGSVFGLSAAGMTSGLAALGLGFGMATGIGAVAAIGVVSFIGVRWATKKIMK